MARIFDKDDGNIPQGTGKKEEVMDELRKIHKKSRASTHLMNAPILSPERPKEQHDKEREAATTAANKSLFEGGKKKRKTRRKKRKTKKRYRNQRGCNR